MTSVRLTQAVAARGNRGSPVRIVGRLSGLANSQILPPSLRRTTTWAKPMSGVGAYRPPNIKSELIMKATALVAARSRELRLANESSSILSAVGSPPLKVDPVPPPDLDGFPTPMMSSGDLASERDSWSTVASCKGTTARGGHFSTRSQIRTCFIHMKVSSL